MPRLIIYYHFLHPDDVVSARQLSDLAAEQVKRGWEVIAVASDRAWHSATERYSSRELWQGVDLRRVHRPAWSQARAVSRLANTAYMLGAWTWHARSLPVADAVIIGSDPAFAALLAIPLKRMHPATPIFHWCFDLYPEAIAAEGLGPTAAALVPIARRLMAVAYRRCDVIVDIGSTMRARLAGYASPARHETLVPWALVEPAEPAPPEPAVRAALFPNARLGLLYAGTMGRAHDFASILALARACRAASGQTISFCFACRGNRMPELRAALRQEDINVSLAPFAKEEDLPARLAAADMHLVSLRPEWRGIVVPSKFFASLAAGRPVLFTGPSDCEIARWLSELQVGLAFAPGDVVAGIVARLHELAALPEALRTLQRRAHAMYATHFSKRVTNDRWDALLRAQLAHPVQEWRGS